MRSKLITCLLAVVSLAACKKEKKTDDSTTCITGNGETNTWRQEDLNRTYTILMPAWYTGGGYILYQGDYYQKFGYGTADTVKVIAQYGKAGVNTSIWGQVLLDASAASVDVEYNAQVFSLKTKKRLCSNDKTIGYYYYTLTRSDTASRNTGLGVVYLFDNADYKQSIFIDFPASKESEALDIASTILPKQ